MIYMPKELSPRVCFFISSLAVKWCVQLFEDSDALYGSEGCWGKKLTGRGWVSKAGVDDTVLTMVISVYSLILLSFSSVISLFLHTVRVTPAETSGPLASSHTDASFKPPISTMTITAAHSIVAHDTILCLWVIVWEAGWQWFHCMC